MDLILKCQSRDFCMNNKSQRLCNFFLLFPTGSLSDFYLNFWLTAPGLVWMMSCWQRQMPSCDYRTTFPRCWYHDMRHLVNLWNPMDLCLKAYLYL